MMVACDEKRLLQLQRKLAKVKLLTVDDPGFVPIGKIARWLKCNTGRLEKI